jgi:hypothetical protein
MLDNHGATHEGRLAPYADRGPNSSERSNGWRVVPGPSGQGECLAQDNGPELLLLAPPGTRLSPTTPERLGRWRTATWVGGELLGEPSEIEDDEAERRAPTKALWIAQRREEQERRDLAVMAGLHASTAVRDPVFSWRIMLQVTQSASTYSTLASKLSWRNPIARVEEAANNASSEAELEEQLGLVAREIGEAQEREIVLGLLHVRARSHSWRYTRALRIFERHTPLERVLARLVDRTRDGQELDTRVKAIELQDRELKPILVRLLYRRMHSVRWVATKPLRRLLALRRLRTTRRALRRTLPPVAEVARAQRSLRSGRQPAQLGPPPDL